MSSALRISVILVLLLATTAFGLIAYNMNLPKAQAPVEVAEKAPAPAAVGYFVAARPLPKGTLARAEDFIVRSVAREGVPKGAILDTGDTQGWPSRFSGSQVRRRWQPSHIARFIAPARSWFSGQRPRTRQPCHQHQG